MATPLDPTTVPTTVLPEGDARDSLRGQAEDNVDTLIADRRWRAALNAWARHILPRGEGRAPVSEGAKAAELRATTPLSGDGSWAGRRSCWSRRFTV